MTCDLSQLLNNLSLASKAEPSALLAAWANEPARTAEELQRLFEGIEALFTRREHSLIRGRGLLYALRVLEAVAAHPNTPPRVLAQAVPYAPAAFCRNPTASLLPLEDPAWTRRVSEPGLRRLLRLPNAPAPIVAAIAAENISDKQHTVSYWEALGESDCPSRYRRGLISLQPTCDDRFLDGPLPPLVREARDHISIASEIETTRELITAVRLREDISLLSKFARGKDEELWDAAQFAHRLHSPFCLRRFIHPVGTKIRLDYFGIGMRRDNYWDSWWFRLSIAEGARPLLGPLWSPPVKRVLNELSQDGHRLVRAAARFRLAEPNRRFPSALAAPSPK